MFCIGFGPLDLGGLATWPEDLQTFVFECVDDTARERLVRTHDREVDGILHRKTDELGGRVRPDVDILAALLGPAFPGAMKMSVSGSDCAIFHASACSRPPRPMIRMRRFTICLPCERYGGALFPVFCAFFI